MASETWMVIDIETVGRLDVSDYLDDLSPRGNLKDPEKIAADLAEKRAAAIANAALDWNANRIVAIGMQTEEDAVPGVWICQDADDEEAALRSVWRRYKDRSRRLVTFAGAGFDVPTLIQRSRFLRVPTPAIDQRKYGNRDQIDLCRELTFDDTQRTSVIRRTLSNFCRLFELDVPDDPHDGSDIARLVADNDWTAVAHHVRTDIVKTQALAQRLGYIGPAGGMTAPSTTVGPVGTTTLHAESAVCPSLPARDLPTLEGRALADLGQQVATLRAQLQQARADAEQCIHPAEREVVKLRERAMALAVTLVDIRHAMRTHGPEWPSLSIRRCIEAINDVCPDVCVECGTTDFDSGRAEGEYGVRCITCATVAALKGGAA